MKLLTKEIEKNLPSLYSNETPDGESINPDPLAVVKFFNPMGAGTWYIFEGSPVDENGELVVGPNNEKVMYDPKVHSDFLMFCIGELGYEGEFGNVSLSELESIKLPFGMGIERDLHYTPVTQSEAKKLTGMI